MKRKFVVRERRTGFDRRQPRRATALGAAWDAALVSLRDNKAAVLAMLVTANLLSTLDYLFTLRALHNGAQEGNPFMKVLLDMNPVLAGGIKIGVIVALSLLMWKMRRYRLILKVAVFAVGLYAAVILWHLYLLTSIA